jgi:hypothetical protein
MRHRIVLLLLIAGFCVADVGMAQRSAIQPIQWIFKESSGADMWPCIAPDGETKSINRPPVEAEPASFQDGRGSSRIITISAITNAAP